MQRFGPPGIPTLETGLHLNCICSSTQWMYVHLFRHYLYIILAYVHWFNYEHRSCPITIAHAYTER